MICCSFENLDVDSLTFTVLHSADTFLNEQQILVLNLEQDERNKIRLKGWPEQNITIEHFGHPETDLNSPLKLNPKKDKKLFLQALIWIFFQHVERPQALGGNAGSCFIGSHILHKRLVKKYMANLQMLVI